MSFRKFVVANWHFLLFGILLTFFSGFGQTFLFSLFVPHFQEVFSLSSGTFGTLYSAATLGSALLLPWVGAWIDRFRLRYYALGVALGMVVSAVLISVAHGLIVLFFGILGMRFFGQALMSHTSQTTMARYFDHVRGKALSVASLGHPIGEAILPYTVAMIIVAIGWRSTWLLIAAVVLVVMVTMIPWLLNFAKADLSAIEKDRDDFAKNNGGKVRSWTRSEMLRDPRFYFIMPAGLASPFLLTGYFLYQVPLAEYKGWTIAWLASCFVAFALAKTTFALLIGPIIDKVTARRVYPFILLPMSLGFFILTLGVSPWIAMVYMFLLGVTEGMSGNTKTAMFAELYGVEYLGAIRSALAAIMVVSTALSPIMMGNLLDAGIAFTTITYGTLIFLGVCIALSLRILPVFEK